MSFSEPPKSLDNSCTVVHENKLYSYNPEGFLSLSLEEGAKWEELKMGLKVTGSTCAGSTPPDAAQAGFFVVGGQSESAEYNGLQKYTYSTGEWTTIKLPSEDAKNRRWHGTTYLSAYDKLVVYGGSTGAMGGSAQTFTIRASEPFTIEGADGYVPAGLSPTLLPWTNADAIMVGGDPANTKVYLFNPTAGWRDFGASLGEPLKDVSIMRAALVQGDDNSKSLLTFDMTVSPNQVKRIVIQDANGTPAVNSPSLKRDLTLSDWPEYNATAAPTETRSNFAMAQGPDGKVIFSGGNTEHPIRIFDVVQNSWADEVSLLSDQKPLKESQPAFSEEATSTASSATSEASSVASETSSATSKATTSSVPASTTASSASSSITSSAISTEGSSILATSSTASPSETAAVPVAGGAASKDNGLSSGAVLGITLGSIVGFLILLGLILVLLRRRKRQSPHPEAAPTRGFGGSPSGEKADMEAFAQNLAPPNAGAFKGHRPTMSQESFSSVAILMGRLGQPKSGLARKPSNDTSRSSVSSLHKQFKNKISKPIPQTSEPSDFQGYNDKGVAFAASVAEPRPRNGPLPAEDGMRRSSGWNKYWSGGSALQLLGFGGPPAPKRGTVASQRSSRYSEAHAPVASRITQDSATVPPLNFEGPAGLSRVNSGSPIVSQYSGDVHLKEEMAGKIERPHSRASSGYSSGVPESVNDSWDPVDSEKPWGTARAPSSAYAPSLYYNTPLAPSTTTNVGSRHPPSGVSTQPQLAMASKSSDMSWLNLGEQRQV